MKFHKIILSTKLIMKMLSRRSIVITLFFVIPIVFLGVVELTTSSRELPFMLGSLDEEIFISVAEKQISLVFFAVAVAGFLSAFLAHYLFQKNYLANRRLVVCGYHPNEVLFSNLIAILIACVFTSFYVGFLVHHFFEVRHFFVFVLALFLSCIVYGLYGMLVGCTVKGELEGILLIVLLINIDAGWLQNPLFYAQSEQQEIIQYLPAFYPSQCAIKASFTDYPVNNSVLYSLLYSGIFLILSIIIFYHKLKLQHEKF